MQRRKGAAGEREFFKLLSEWSGEKVTRRLGQARDGGHDGDYGPLSIEVKRRSAFSVLRHYDQAVKAARGKVPVVALREDCGEWMVLLTAKDFLALSVFHPTMK